MPEYVRRDISAEMIGLAKHNLSDLRNVFLLPIAAALGVP
jgi:hypothetical protein